MVVETTIQVSFDFNLRAFDMLRKVQYLFIMSSEASGIKDTVEDNMGMLEPDIK